MNILRPHRLLSCREAARFLGVKEATLEMWQANKPYQIPIVTIGKLVKYHYSDLCEFRERRTIAL